MDMITLMGTINKLLTGGDTTNGENMKSMNTEKIDNIEKGGADKGEEALEPPLPFYKSKNDLQTTTE